MPFSPAVQSAASAAVRVRERVAADLAAGRPAVEICAEAARGFGALVVGLWESAIGGLPPGDTDLVRRHVALVAHGGFGRFRMAPWSDIDLAIVHRPEAAAAVAPVARRLLQDLFDAGLEVGQSVRTVEEACELAGQDATVLSTLLDARTLAGPADLGEELSRRVDAVACRAPGATAARLVAARRAEVRRHGGTVALLEPDVKRSAGCLRDVQMIRWLARVLHGERSLDGLAERGAISAEDARAVAAAEESILRTRIDLHLAAGKAAETLTRTEQVRIAEALGMASGDGLLAAERFMQRFLGHTRAVARVVESLLPDDEDDDATGEVVEGLFRVGPRRVAAVAGREGDVADDAAAVVRLVALAAERAKPVDRGLWNRVRATADSLPREPGAAAIAAFRESLDRPAGLADALRRLHDAALLERFVPPFSHARDLLQFNNYHKYTVDEHCILAVERAAGFADDPGWLGDTWRGLTRRRPLLLATLVHDLGKGFPEDHSVVGARMARDVCARLGIPAEESEIVELLVLEHLTMAHLAFRRDSGDDSLVVPFARRVGSPEVLRMLSLLTAADVAAVGPGTWTRWKSDLLADIHFRTLRWLDGESIAAPAGERRAAVGAAAARLAAGPRVAELARRAPDSLLASAATERLVADLTRLAALPRDGVFATAEWDAETGTVAVTVGTRSEATSGPFHRIAGALACARLGVLAADVHPFGEGLSLARFTVSDGDFDGEPPADRLAEIGAAIRDAVRAETPPTFARRWNPFAPRVATPPPRVLVDNESSARATIVEVFANDAPGLLSGITRTLAEEGLVVRSARVATHLDQVVDAFHVTDAAGEKIADADRIASLRRALERVVSPLTGPG